MADVDLEPLSVDDCVSTWTWALSIGPGERPLDGTSVSVFAMVASSMSYRIFMP